MNRKQKIALWVGVVNLAMILLFPSFDSFSFTDTKALIFAGFQFVFTRDSNEVINGDVLFLEIVVLLVNVGVAWLLLRDAADLSGVLFHFPGGTDAHHRYADPLSGSDIRAVQRRSAVVVVHERKKLWNCPRRKPCS